MHVQGGFGINICSDQAAPVRAESGDHRSCERALKYAGVGIGVVLQAFYDGRFHAAQLKLFIILAHIHREGIC